VPSGLVLTHDGKLLIVAAGEYVIFFDTERLKTGENGAAFQWVSDGPGAASICANVTEDDKTLFVSDERTATITVIDLEIIRSLGYDSPANLKRFDSNGGNSGAIVGRIPVGGSPVALTFSPDQRWLYTTSESAKPEWEWPRVIPQENPAPGQAAKMVPEGAVIVVDVTKAKSDARNSTVARVPAGGSPVRLALSPAGDRLFVTARESNALLVFDTARLITDPSHAKLATIAVGKSPVPVALIEDGKIALVGNSNRYGPDANKSSTLTILDTAKIGTPSKAIIASVPAGAYPRNFCLSPDGQTLYLTNYVSGSLQVMNVSSLPHEPAR
jgi:DNA-binding beta-propeller fold protein YncE